MNGLPYYKAYPRDFIEGTIGMEFEVKCAYRVVLDMIYAQGGNLPDDPRYISGTLGCSIRKWKSIRDKLVSLGKINVSGGFITNNRADKELETLSKLQEKQRENRSRPNKNKDLQSPRSNHTEPEPDIISDTNVSLGGDLAKAVKRFNDAAEKAGWPKVQKLNPTRSKLLRARLAECGGADGWEVALRKAFESDFFKTQWTGFCFDWMIRAANFTKIMEGNYDNRDSKTNRPGGVSSQPDPLERIARLTRLSEASGSGGV
jgi:uncharacterized protein YdaU (DUF1376 family)